MSVKNSFVESHRPSKRLLRSQQSWRGLRPLRTPFQGSQKSSDWVLSVVEEKNMTGIGHDDRSRREDGVSEEIMMIRPATVLLVRRDANAVGENTVRMIAFTATLSVIGVARYATSSASAEHRQRRGR